MRRRMIRRRGRPGRRRSFSRRRRVGTKRTRAIRIGYRM